MFRRWVYLLPFLCLPPSGQICLWTHLSLVDDDDLTHQFFKLMRQAAYGHVTVPLGAGSPDQPS